MERRVAVLIVCTLSTLYFLGNGVLAAPFDAKPSDGKVNPNTPTTSTTSPAPITNSTTKPTTPTPPIPPSTSSTTPTSSTTTPTTTSKPTPPITSTVPPVPSSSTIPAPTSPAPQPQPHDRSFDLPSFVGGIILALGIIAIGYVVYKFYKARTDPDYRTL